MTSASKVNLSQSFKLKPEYFFSNSNQHLQLINVAVDDAIIFRFSGSCKNVFSALSKGQTLAEIKESLINEFPEQSPQEIEAFLLEFIGELVEMDVFDN